MKSRVLLLALFFCQSSGVGLFAIENSRSVVLNPTEQAGRVYRNRPEDHGQYDSLVELLAVKGRWKVLRGLTLWQKKLSMEEVQQLEDFALENKHNDWALNCSARALLRRNLPDKYAVSPQVKRAQELFMKIRPGKVSQSNYRKYVGEIASLGNDILPMLFDLLEYRQPHDFYRKDVAIKVLAVLEDARIIGALQEIISSEQHRNLLEQELRAVLKHDSSNGMVDYVAELIAGQESAFDQEYVISFLSRSDLLDGVKMRLYSHYDGFKGYGRDAVIRGLARIDDGNSFSQLVGIFRRECKSYGHTFRVAAYELSRMHNSDPSGLFLETLEKAPERVCRSLIVPLSEKKHTPAILLLEKKIAQSSDSAHGIRCRIWAAGALCRLGKDYEKNAAIVRKYLRADYDPSYAGYAPYGAVGWLNDKETLNILVTKLTTDKPENTALKWTIQALGRIGDESALSALREGLTRYELEQFENVGDAIVRIGRTNNNAAVVSEGETVKIAARFVMNWGMQQQREAAGGEEAERRKQEYERVAEWLTKRPKVVANISERSKSRHNHESIVGLMKRMLQNKWEVVK